jgi:phosphoribosylaminoimidazolecarboxamide formyltransferase/IMP cyclohydrolase
MTELELKYGCNPNQKPARIFIRAARFRSLCSAKPRYINFLAPSHWQLVRS